MPALVGLEGCRVHLSDAYCMRNRISQFLKYLLAANQLLLIIATGPLHQCSSPCCDLRVDAETNRGRGGCGFASHSACTHGHRTSTSSPSRTCVFGHEETDKSESPAAPEPHDCSDCLICHVLWAGRTIDAAVSVDSEYRPSQPLLALPTATMVSRPLPSMQSRGPPLQLSQDRSRSL